MAQLRSRDIYLRADGEALRINAPKGALSIQLRNEIAARKAELLAFLGSGAATPVIGRRSGAAAPLSLAQERLWFLNQLDPESPLYNLCRAAHLRGPLNLQALTKSLEEIVRRHEVLRSKICLVDGRPSQMALASVESVLPVKDLRRLPSAKRESAIRRHIARTAHTPFDLASGKLLRAHLLRGSDAEHILVIATHHIVADAWSMGILNRELWSLYGAYAAGQDSPLAPLPIQYGDFTFWQRQTLQTAKLSEQIDYWRKQLADLPTFDLPTDRRRPPRLSHRGGRLPLSLAPPLAAAVNKLAAQENATPFMVLLAAFQVLLYRYSGQDDIAVGTAVTNRPHAECESLIGFFVNTLVLRGDLRGRPRFREYLRRVREVSLDALARQDVPFEKMVEELKPQRELNRQPFFQTLFVLQNTPRLPVLPEGLQVEPLEVDIAAAQYDLSLYLRERGGQLLGYFEYASDLFDAATVERMAGHFARLLESIAADADQAIDALPLLSAGERRRMLVDWNDTVGDYPEGLTIHELFEAQVQRTPEAVAVEFGSLRLTYAELNRRANQVAHYLRSRGVGPEQPVGLMVGRSVEMVIGLLAILKAGGAYVPLDPNYPQARLDFMIADAGCELLLSVGKLAANKFTSSIAAVCLDDDQLFAGESGDNPSNLSAPEHAAYIIYTSGSTGSPKGAVGSHRGVVNRCAWMWQRYPFAPGEVCCNKTSLSFVDSVWELFGPLLRGVPLVIAEDDSSGDAQALLELLAKKRVSRIVLVPSLLKALLDVGAKLAGKLPQLKLWTCSGEALSSELAERFRKSHGQARLLNLYGSSEVAADATYFEYDGKARAGGVPIGKPIANMAVYVLDELRQPVPIGVTGELYIGGAGLARGYWRRPELTEEKFVGHPFTNDAAARLFRSGDLARYLPDGNLEYLGRADGQVKIAGQRIELGEIEAALRGHGKVADCVVTWQAQEGEEFHIPHSKLQIPHPGNSLAAYIVGDALPSDRELREFLRLRLPNFMVPSRFVRVASIPLLPNGKVDRRSLPTQTSEPMVSDSAALAPRNETEAKVAALWREVLKLPRVGVDRDFFELGGHSILAMQVVARLRALFACEFALGDLFAAPTVAGIAARLNQQCSTELLPIRSMAQRGAAPLSSAQELYWRMDDLLSGADFLNLPYGYRLTGPLNEPALRRSLEAIVARHDMLRTVFKEHHGELRQIVRKRMRLPLKQFDLSAKPLAKRQALLEQISAADAQAPFDLAKGPPLRVTLVRLSAEEHILLVTLHHIIADQWSLRLLRRELCEFYKANVEGGEAALADLPFQFGDFSLWQREMLAQGKFAGQLNYWKKRLAGRLTPIEFPLGGKRRRLTLQAARLAAEFSAELSAAIHQLARSQRTTPFVVLAAALNLWLYRLTGRRDAPIGTLVANRQQPGTELLIGYFVNAVVLRTPLTPDMTFLQLLQRIAVTAQEALAHQDIPIAEIGRLVQQNSKSAGTTPYQVMVNYRRFTDEPENCAGLTIAHWSKGSDRAADAEVALTAAELSFEFRELPTKLTVTVNYRCSLFDEKDAQRLLDSFTAILAGAVGQPERRLRSVPMATKF